AVFSGVTISSFNVAATMSFVTLQRFNASSFHNHIDAALHVEVLFGNFVMFAIEDFFEAAHRLRDRNILAFRAGKNFSDMERLAEEALNLAGAQNGEFVLGT